MEKKKWVQPELIVLVKRKPEEGILNGCKSFMLTDGPEETVMACDMGPCDPCSENADS